DRQAHAVDGHERQHAVEDGAGGHLWQQRVEHEEVHADRRADEADLDHHHDQDAEPDGIDPQVHDEREEHRHVEQDHRQLLHRGTEDQVDHHDRADHHYRADLQTLDEVLQIRGLLVEGDTLG